MTVVPRAPSDRRLTRPAQLAPTALVRRRLRADVGVALASVALIGVTCSVFAALPRLFERFSDRGLHYSLAHAAVLDRNVQATETARIGAAAGADPLALVGKRATEFGQALPQPIRRLVAGRAFVVRSQQYAAPGPPSVMRILTLVEQNGVWPKVRLTAGRMPRSTRTIVRTFSTVHTELGDLRKPVRVPLVEVALSVQTARHLYVHLGDRLVLPPNPTVSTEITPTADERPLAVKVVGLFTVPHPDAPFWFSDTRLDTPEIQKSQDLNQNVYGEALLTPEQYSTMLGATQPLGLSYEYRYLVDSRRLNASQVVGVQAAAAELSARYADTGPVDRTISTGLGSVVADYRSERSQAETLLAVATFSLLACALANLGLLAALSFDRRRTETGLTRIRGALPRQVLLTQLLEGLLLAVPAGLAGWAVAVLAVGGRGNSLSVWLVVAVVVGAVLLQAAGVARHARRTLRPPERDALPAPGRASPRRIVVEALLVVLAGLGVYLLRRRGLSSAGAGLDPYLTAVPVLLALAAGIVALRLYPLPVGGAARLARRSRGLTLHLALSRAARQSEIALAPLLVLVLALALAVFSVAMLHTLDAGQTQTASRQVGADLRVDAAPGRSLPASLLARLRREGTVAPAFVLDDALADATEDTIFLALDTRAYERAASGAAAPGRTLTTLDKPSPLGGFVPALMSPDWPGGGLSAAATQLDVQQAIVSLVTTARARSFAGLPTGVPFAVASLQAIERQTHYRIRPNRLYLRGVGASAVRRAVAAVAPGASVTSRADVLRRLRASPFVGSVGDGFRLAIALAALYAVVAVVLLVLIASRSRARDLALVRTMGGSPRDALRLAAVELAPPLLVALALGVGLGVALLYLVAPAVDFSFFTGNSARLLSVPWPAALALAGGAAAVVAAAVVVTSAKTRRAELSRVLRFGER